MADIPENEVIRLAKLYAEAMYGKFKAERINIHDEYFYAIENPHGLASLRVEVLRNVCQNNGFDLNKLMRQPSWLEKTPNLQSLIEQGYEYFCRKYFVGGHIGENDCPPSKIDFKPEFRYDSWA